MSDETSNFLPGVLVSLSGGNFRQNRITVENDSLIFSNLVSSDYSEIKELDFN